MISKTIQLVAVAALVLGSAGYAHACGDKAKDSNAKASYASSEAHSGCASKKASAASADAHSGCASKKASATVASKSGSGCGSHANKSAALAGKDGDHCGVTKAALAGADCVYGENTVTLNGSCPGGTREADYAFAVKNAECRGTGADIARAFKAVPGVAAVTVDYVNQMAYVCVDTKLTNQKTIAKSLKKAGYSEVKFVNATKDNCQKSHGKVDA